MQFILVAYDYADKGAPARRQAVREAHLSKVRDMKEDGLFLHGGALLDAEGRMTGSVIIYEVPNRAYLDALLEDEPYLNGRVWEKIRIEPFQLAQI